MKSVSRFDMPGQNLLLFVFASSCFSKPAHLVAFVDGSAFDRFRLLALRGGEDLVKPFVHREELQKETHPAQSLFFGTDARKRMAKRLLRSSSDIENDFAHEAKIRIQRAADEDLIVPDQCESLKEALRQVLPGQSVFVRAGEHRWRQELIAPTNISLEVRGELGARLWGQWARRGQQVCEKIFHTTDLLRKA